MIFLSPSLRISSFIKLRGSGAAKPTRIFTLLRCQKPHLLRLHLLQFLFDLTKLCLTSARDMQKWGPKTGHIFLFCRNFPHGLKFNHSILGLEFPHVWNFPHVRNFIVGLEFSARPIESPGGLNNNWQQPEVTPVAYGCLTRKGLPHISTYWDRSKPSTPSVNIKMLGFMDVHPLKWYL